MTDTPGTATGWRSATVLAPAAAAALAVATGWAVAHPPPGSAAPTAAPHVVPVERTAVDRVDVRLHRQALAAQDRVVHLTRVLHRVQARTRALRDAPLRVGGVSTGGYAAGRGGGVSVPAPPVAAAPAPAPASHTSTGAS